MFFQGWMLNCLLRVVEIKIEMRKLLKILVDHKCVYLELALAVPTLK